MADNQKQSSSKESKKKSRKSRSRIRDGVVLRASVIERERERLYRRPRAALYPLLPIMEPTKFKRQSIRVAKNKKRHRKHCRKRTHRVEPEEEEEPPPRSGLNSRTRLVPTTTSESEGGSLACSKQPVVLTAALNNQCPRCSPALKPAVLSDWGSVELYADGEEGDDDDDDEVEEVRGASNLKHPQVHVICQQLEPPAPPHQPHHHHHYHHRHRHRICHHSAAARKFDRHRSSLTTTKSLDDMRRTSKAPSSSSHHHCRHFDPEIGRLKDADKDSASNNSRSRKIVSFIVGSVASFILLMCVALVAVTLRLTPAIDALVRKENEEIYRAMSSGPSTAAPVADGSTVGTANVTGTDHTG